MSAIDERVNCVARLPESRSQFARTLAHDRAVGRDRDVGRRRGLPDRHRRLRVQPRTSAALHLHRPARREHRPGPPHALRHSGLAAVRLGSGRLRPQQGGGRPHRDGRRCGTGRSTPTVGCSSAPCRRCGCRSDSSCPIRRGGKSSISTVYMSFFILPYVVAGVLWLRNREEWKAFVKLFVGLSFAALVIYALLPAAPPWAAARCTAADVEGGPAGPRCMFRPARGVPDGGLLGAMQTTQDGANGWIERIVGRGWGKLNLHTASALIDQGQASVNLVAAIPSLHAGLTAGDRGVPVEPRAPPVAAAAGGLRARHGVHAGVHRRALRHRHPARMGAGRGRHGADQFGRADGKGRERRRIAATFAALARGRESGITSLVRLSRKCNIMAWQTRMSSPTRFRRWRTTTRPRPRC